MKKSILSLLAVSMILFSCEQKPDPKTTFKSIQEIENLYSQEIIVQKVASHKDTNILGYRTLYYPIKYTILTGINMKKAKIHINNGNVEITLPEAEILHEPIQHDIDPNEITTEVGFLRRKFKAEDISALNSKVELNLKNELGSLDLLKET